MKRPGAAGNAYWFWRVDIVWMKTEERRRRATSYSTSPSIAVTHWRRNHTTQRQPSPSSHGVRTPTILQAESQGGVRVPISVQPFWHWTITILCETMRNPCRYVVQYSFLTCTLCPLSTVPQNGRRRTRTRNFIEIVFDFQNSAILQNRGPDLFFDGKSSIEIPWNSLVNLPWKFHVGKNMKLQGNPKEFRLGVLHGITMEHDRSPWSFYIFLST